MAAYADRGERREPRFLRFRRSTAGVGRTTDT